jgi:hypothetical protein
MHITQTNMLSRRGGAIWLWLALAILLQLGAGCNRTFYRRQADMEA